MATSVLHVGTDSFTYKLTDQWGQDSNLATVTIDVTNEAPEAVPDSYEVHAGESLDVSWVNGVVANDTDEDGDELQAELLQDVSHGTLVLNDDGSFVYTPDATFTGTDGFLYWATDGITTIPSEPYQDFPDDDVAWVTIEVTNEVPIASPDEF